LQLDQVSGYVPKIRSHLVSSMKTLMIGSGSSIQRKAMFCVLACAMIWSSHWILGQTTQYTFTTVAGSAHSGSDNGTGTTARFKHPWGMALDGAGNVYVGDNGNHTIRKITPNGIVSTLAGQTGITGSTDGTGSAARFGSAADGTLGLGTDNSGNIYVADRGNHTVRKINSAGVVSTLAGLAGSAGSADGPTTAARFYFPAGLAVDSVGNVYVADWPNCTVRKITPNGMVSTLAGLAGSPGSADGPATAARFSFPTDLAVDRTDNIYVADSGNNTIRKITPGGVVSTLAGLAGQTGSMDGTAGGARFDDPTGVATDSVGNVYVADKNNYVIRKITPSAVVSTLVGRAGSGGSVDGIGSAARFGTVAKVVVDSSGTVYASDFGNNTIRKVSADGTASTLAGLGGIGSADGPGNTAQFFHSYGVAVDSADSIYVADTFNHTIRKMTPAGTVSTLAGQAGNPGRVNGTVTAARFYFPASVAIDLAGTMYVTEIHNHQIRRITPGGVVSTLAGSPNGDAGSTDGAGSAARFNRPFGVTVDTLGNLYVADSANHTIRRITPNGTVTTWAGSAGISGSADGTRSSARFSFPTGLVLDGGGNLYVADSDNHVIRKIASNGLVSTPAGLVNYIGNVDAKGSAARFYSPFGLAVDRAGNVYVGDYGNHTIRRLTPDGTVSTIGGAANNPGTLDGIGNAARFDTPIGLAVDSAGILYVADNGNSTIRKGVPGISPPVITQQPQDTTVAPGGTATLTAAALGTAPFTFQWYFGSTTLAGETNATLTLRNVETNQAGIYRLVVSNPYGSVSSSGAELTVINPPVAASAADIRRGLVAYWPLDTIVGVTTPDVTPFGNHLNLVNMDINNFVVGKRGKAASFNGSDELLSLVYQPGGGNGLPIYNARRYTVAFWVNAVGATQGGGGGGDRRVFSEASDRNGNPLFTIGTDSAEAATRTNVVDLLVRDNFVTTQVNHTKSRGMAFDGTWHHVAWVEEDGAARMYIDGQLDATVFNYTRGSLDLNTISVGAIQRSGPGNYFGGLIDEVAIWERPLAQAEIQDVVTNGIPTQAASFAPSIVFQPRGATNLIVGASYTLAAQVTGTRPLTYEWRRNDLVIPGAVNPTLALDGLKQVDSGDYTLLVRNSLGSITSQVATVVVSPAPPPLISSVLESGGDAAAIQAQYTGQTFNHPNFGTITVGHFGADVPAYTDRNYRWNGIRNNFDTVRSLPPYLVNGEYIVLGNDQRDNNNYALTITVSRPALAYLLIDNRGSPSDGRTDDPPDLGKGTNRIGLPFMKWVLDAGFTPVTTGWNRFNNSSAPDEAGIDGEVSGNGPVLSIEGFCSVYAKSVSGTFVLHEMAVGSRDMYAIVISTTPPRPVPPEILQQPQDVTVDRSQNATFTVAASGTAPLLYQWYFANSSLAGATNATLVLSNVATNADGEYYVIVTNPSGDLLFSRTARLTVIVPTPPVIVQPPQDLRVVWGATVTFSVLASGTSPFQYEWSFNGATLPGETNSVLTVRNVTANHAGSYLVTVSNRTGSRVSSPAGSLTVDLPPPPVIGQQPSDTTVERGSTASFAVTASGTPPLLYQWFFGRNPLAGETNAALALRNVATNQAGLYTVAVSNPSSVSVSSRDARLTVTIPTPPSITGQPADLTVDWGATATFAVVATGAPPLQYEWFYGTNRLAGESNATLTLRNVTTNQAGGYKVVIRNPSGADLASREVFLTVNLPPPPIITQQPKDLTVDWGLTVTFTVGASGTPPFLYQWFSGTNTIAGETNAALTLRNVTTNHIGEYKVAVSNPSGVAVTSQPARLTVNIPAPPTISRQPQDATVDKGGTATFVVEASGSVPFLYQWFRGASSLPAEVNATLTLRNVATNQSGTYRVVVSNPYGSVSSTSALLTVIDPLAPPAHDLFLNRTVLSGLTTSVTNSNANASREAGEPSHAGNTGGKSIWWTWTAPRNGNVTLSTAGSSADTVLAVYTGTTLASLVPVASNDDDPRGGTSSLVTFRAQAGVAYQIAVDTFGGLTGLIQLSLTAQVERPVLQMSLSGQNVVLNWPTNAAGFNLEVSASLTPAAWNGISQEPLVIGENYSLKLPLGSRSQFYRLNGP
jgi:hypothetical protein